MVIAILVNLANLVLYRAFQENAILSSLLLVEGVLLYRSLSDRKSSLITLSSLVLMLVLIFLSLKSSFDKDLIRYTALETDTTIRRQEYYAWSLGKIYRNRFGLFYFNYLSTFLTKFQRNLFSHLDLNLFFRTSSLLSLSFLALFAEGLSVLFNKPAKIILIYFFTTLFVGGFLSFYSNLGFFLFVPVVNLAITSGIIKFSRIFLR